MSNLICLSYNAGGAFGARDSLEGFLSRLSIVAPFWSIIFVSEFDGALTNVPHTFELDSHVIHRHWPGDGSRSCAFILNRRIVSFARKVDWCGRAGAVHFYSVDPNTGLGANVIVTGLHGAHGDLLGESLADASAVIHSVRKGIGVHAKRLIIGDINVDYLPTLDNDPWRELEGRGDHHADRRLLFETWLESAGVELVLPSRMSGSPGGSWPLDLLQVPCSRVPVGCQNGFPSLIDVGGASQSLIRSCWVDWDGVDADHAFVFYDVVCHFQVPRRARKSWLCTSEQEVMEHLQTFTFSSTSTPEDICASLISIQALYDSDQTCEQRRADRMPFELRELYSRAAHSDNNADRQMWQKRARLRRAQWVADTRVLSRKRAVASGRVLSKSKKLHKINSLNVDGFECIDPQANVEVLAKAFGTKWGGKNLTLREKVSDILNFTDGLQLQIGVEDVAGAFKMLRKRHRLDWQGFSTQILELLYLAQPEQFTSWMIHCLSGRGAMDKFIVRALAFGKVSGRASVDTVRVIAPLPAIMQLADALIARLLSRFVDQCFPRTPEIWEGAVPFTQILDITGGLTAVIEKDMDYASGSAIAQLDVRQHYDTLATVRIYEWLVSNGCDAALAAAAFRHQMCPQVFVALGCHHAAVGKRSKGGLTGSRVAGVLGRVPVLASLKDNILDMKRLAFHRESVCLVACTFVDNIFVVGRSSWAACAIADMFSEALEKRWNQQVKPGSRMVLPVFPGLEPEVTSDAWPVVRQMMVLGHVLDSRGNVQPDYDNAVRMLWRSFFANAGAFQAHRLPQRVRLCLMQRATVPVLDQHCSRWPFTMHRAGHLDRLQRKMLASCMRIQPLPEEDAGSYMRRRGRSAGTLQRQLGLWSVRWARQVTQWHAHICRDRNGLTWMAQLQALRSPEMLNWRRAEYRRPCTRAQPGFCSARWYESVPIAQQWLDTRSQTGST